MRVVLEQDDEGEYGIAKMREKWASEVGRFVMAFGSIEGTTYAAMRHCPRDKIGEPLIEANLSLKPRVDLLIAVASGRGGKRWHEFADLLRRVKTLSGKRNLIAHNGVGFDVFIDAAGEFFVEEGISNSKKPLPKDRKAAAKDRIAFEELVEHRKQAEELADKLLYSLLNILQLVGAEQSGDTAFIEKFKDN